MLNIISDAIRFETPAASAVLYTAASLLAGRKFCMAAGYKLGGAVAEYLGKQNVSEWNKASSAYLTMAKKDAVRDLTAIAALIAVTGYVLGPKEEGLPVNPPKSSAPEYDIISEHPYLAGSIPIVAFLIHQIYKNFNHNLCASLAIKV